LKKVLMMALLLGSVGGRALYAQELDGPADRFGVEIGFGPLANQDLLASPFVYHSTHWPLAVLYEHDGELNRHSARIWFQGTTLESVITGKLGGESHSSEFVSLGASYGYSRLLVRFFNDRLPVFLGGSWTTNFTFRIYDYGPSVPDETIVEGFSSFSLRAEARYPVSSQGQFSFTFDGSIVSFTYRNPYGLSSNRDAAEAINHSFLSAFLTLGSWRWLDTFFTMDNRLSYIQTLSSSFDLRGSYDLTYRRFADPRTSTTVTQTVNAGLFYKF
jgi:hypothetical protein